MKYKNRYKAWKNGLYWSGGNLWDVRKLLKRDRIKRTCRFWRRELRKGFYE